MTPTLQPTLKIPTSAQMLEQRTIAVRTAFRWPSRRPPLYNLKLPSLKEIGSLKGQIKQFVEHRTVPYVDAGVRLLRREGVAEFNERMTELQSILVQAAQKVQEERDVILADARKRLNKAFNEANYPHDFSTLFGMEWSFPSIEPPNYLAALGKLGISLAPRLHADNMGNNRREVARSNHMRMRWLTRRTGRRGRGRRRRTRQCENGRSSPRWRP